MEYQVRDRIIAMLGNVGEPLCDDCLSSVLGLSRRQHANAECNRLSSTGTIVRLTDICIGCGGRKLTNRLPQTGVASAPEIRIPLRRPTMTEWSPKDRPTMPFLYYPFSWVGPIDPERDSQGDLRTFVPRVADADVRGLAIHRHGQGPFCKFRIPPDIQAAGVYAIGDEGRAKYIGRCDNLSKRFNIGYGQISPRNCYEGGQQTNCRINHLVFEHISSGEQLSLWFHATSESEAIERQLLQALHPDWNRALV